MAKKRTLRTISSELPTASATEDLFLNLHHKEDREAAIVGASLVESALQESLTKAFDSQAPGLERRLFEHRGPLTGFNSKILVAEAFAVISDRLADDMHRIRNIRNCFAHASIDVDLASL